MSKISIWPGSSSFNSVEQPTPFGFYDDDNDFRNEADKVANYVVQRLGYPLVDIELQDINLYSCFEEAVSEYGGQVYNYQIINNLITLKGKSTGSALNQINIDSSYGGGTDNYSGGGSSYGGGGSGLDPFQLQTGSLEVSKNQQKYDLLSVAGSSINSTPALTAIFPLGFLLILEGNGTRSKSLVNPFPSPGDPNSPAEALVTTALVAGIL